jgi:hypothetical protein
MMAEAGATTIAETVMIETAVFLAFELWAIKSSTVPAEMAVAAIHVFPVPASAASIHVMMKIAVKILVEATLAATITTTETAVMFSMMMGDDSGQNEN